jgi:hypothetical protein
VGVLHAAQARHGQLVAGPADLRQPPEQIPGGLRCGLKVRGRLWTLGGLAASRSDHPVAAGGHSDPPPQSVWGDVGRFDWLPVTAGVHFRSGPGGLGSLTPTVSPLGVLALVAAGELLQGRRSKPPVVRHSHGGDLLGVDGARCVRCVLHGCRTRPREGEPRKASSLSRGRQTHRRQRADPGGQPYKSPPTSRPERLRAVPPARPEREQ